MQLQWTIFFRVVLSEPDTAAVYASASYLGQQGC